MALTEADIEQFITALQEDPQLRDRVRNAILADDFLALPGIVARLGERVDQLGERVDQLGERVDQLGERVDQLGRRVDQLGERLDQLTVQVQQIALKMDRFDGRIGNLEGETYETRYVLNLQSHLAPVLRGVRRVFPADVPFVLDAYQSGALSEIEWDEIHRLDVLAAGRSVKVKGETPERHLGIELSIVVDASDVDRAAKRSALLSAHGLPTEAAVDGKAITADAEQRATELGVKVLVRKVLA